MKKLFLLPVLGLALASCGNTANNSQADSTQTDSTAVEVVAATTVEATYAGVLPAADAPGIETTLELKADGSFVQSQKEVNGQDLPSTMGTYTLTGDTLVLTSDMVDYALLQGDSVVLLNADRQVSELPYVLRKK